MARQLTPEQERALAIARARRRRVEAEAEAASTAAPTPTTPAPDPDAGPKPQAQPSGAADEGPLDLATARGKALARSMRGEAPVSARALSAAQGATFGFADDIAAGVNAAGAGLGAAVRGRNPIKAADEEFREKRAFAQQLVSDFREDRPLQAAGLEIAPAVAGGAGLFKAGATATRLVPGALSRATTPLGRAANVTATTGAAAADGAGFGALTAAGEGRDIVEDARTGGAIGAGANLLLRGAGAGLRGLFGRTKKPPVPSLDDLKSDAARRYRIVDDAGVQYSPDQIAGLKSGILDEVPTTGLGAITTRNEPVTSAAVRQLSRQPADAPVRLSELDSLRSMAGSAQPRTNDARLAGILRNEVDEFMERVTPAVGGDEAHHSLKQARDAWGRFKRAETIDDALVKADLRAASNYAGAGAETATRRNLRRLLDNPRQASRFTAEERKAIERVVRGSPAQNVARTLGKLAPTNVVSAGLGSGNAALLGGMLAGPGGAAAAGLTAATVGSGAKAVSNRLAQRNVDELVRLVRTGEPIKKGMSAKEVLEMEARRREIAQALGVAGTSAATQ